MGPQDETRRSVSRCCKLLIFDGGTLICKDSWTGRPGTHFPLFGKSTSKSSHDGELDSRRLVSPAADHVQGWRHAPHTLKGPILVLMLSAVTSLKSLITFYLNACFVHDIWWDEQACA